ncbi:MAG TPA: hypothetical protein VJP02_11730 [Candidatus Sulfotelmatobacter sp.]|nr:hypothetical protein [Candidatus Sulfotelmatobacter sp.]
MPNEKERRPGWCESAGRRLDEFGQWVNRRCGVPLRRFVKWLVRIVETAVGTVVTAVKTTVEAVVQDQTVKTIVAGAKAVAEVADRVLHIREWYERMVWLVAWLGALIQQMFCATNCAACASVLLCNSAYTVAFAAVVMASLFILYFVGIVMRA